MPPEKEMIGSDEMTSDSKWLKLVPDLSTIFSLEDINMVKPGKIAIKGNAVSGSGRGIERLEISLDRWNSCVEASGKQDKNKSACMSFEATIDDDVSQTIHVMAKQIKVRAKVRIDDSDFLASFYYEASGKFVCGEIRKIRIGNAVLWVDEESRDYFVVWNLDCFFAYHKKGDDNRSWKVFQPLKNQGCVHMVFKESKLYVLSLSRNITVYDFSGDDAPKECASFPPPDHRQKQHFNDLAVTLSGEVLIIAGGVKPPMICYFKVYRMDPKSSKWIETHSIGNEALFLDLGTTVAAKDGVDKNCVYFSNDQFHRYNGISLCYETSICAYNIQTNKVFKRFQHLAASSPKLFEDARWFFPTFAGKWLL